MNAFDCNRITREISRPNHADQRLDQEQKTTVRTAMDDARAFGTNSFVRNDGEDSIAWFEKNANKRLIRCREMQFKFGNVSLWPVVCSIHRIGSSTVGLFRIKKKKKNLNACVWVSYIRPRQTNSAPQTSWILRSQCSILYFPFHFAT